MTVPATSAVRATRAPVDVLVVDDDEGLRSFLRVVLLLNLETALGATTEAASVEDALDAVADRAPDVVLVALDGPRVDPHGVMPVLRALAPEARVVAYSALRRRRPSWADACITRGDVIAVGPLLDAMKG